MRWRRFVTSLGLCRLFKGLMALAVIKLALLGMVSWQIIVPQPDGTKAVVRVSTVQVANAQEDSAPKPAPKESTAPAQAEAKAVKKDERQVLDRETMLRKQEDLDRRERELKALEQKIAQDMASLEERRAQLQRMLEDAKEVKNKKDKHLVDVFTNMKSKQAASVLETMDERQAVKILSGMRGRQAGEILTFVKAEKAARLAEQLTRLQVPFE